MCLLESIGVAYLTVIPCLVRNRFDGALPVAEATYKFQPNLALEAFLPYSVE
jgi:hypothetical protein